CFQVPVLHCSFVNLPKKGCGSLTRLSSWKFWIIIIKASFSFSKSFSWPSITKDLSVGKLRLKGRSLYIIGFARGPKFLPTKFRGILYFPSPLLLVAAHEPAFVPHSSCPTVPATGEQDY